MSYPPVYPPLHKADAGSYRVRYWQQAEVIPI